MINLSPETIGYLQLLISAALQARGSCRPEPRPGQLAPGGASASERERRSRGLRGRGVGRRGLHSTVADRRVAHRERANEGTNEQLMAMKKGKKGQKKAGLSLLGDDDEGGPYIRAQRAKGKGLLEGRTNYMYGM